MSMMTVWPGEKYHSPYDINSLYDVVSDYIQKHPKAPLSQVHGYCVNHYGACNYHHVKAVWVLIKKTY